MSRRGAREGSIYRRADGRWAASISVGYSAGTRKRKTYYGRTRSAVQQALTKAIHDLQMGLPVVRDERVTMEAFLTGWLDDVRPSLRPSTHARYSELARIHVVPGLGRIPLTRLTPQHIQALLSAKLTAGLSPRTVNHIRAVVRSALNQAVRWGMIPRNAAALATAPRVSSRQLTPLSADEARTLLTAAAGDRLGGLYAVALTTGMRQGELLGLSWSDVDFDAGTLRVQHALQRVAGRLVLVEPKSERSKRVLALPRTAVDALVRQRARQREERLLAGSRWKEHGLVFASTIGTPLNNTNVTHRFQRLLREAGLPRQRFHDLRHACASLLLSQGVHPRVVMETLGHSQISLTMNTYSHVVPALQRDAAQQMEALLAERTS